MESGRQSLSHSDSLLAGICRISGIGGRLGKLQTDHKSHPVLPNPPTFMEVRFSFQKIATIWVPSKVHSGRKMGIGKMGKNCKLS
jgi:hypothetical protein